MAATFEDAVPITPESVRLAQPADVEYGPREDIPRRMNEAVATIGGCALAMGLLFLLLR